MLSYLEVSKKNLLKNFTTLKAVAKKGTKIALAVKGNAYGHGLKEIVSVLNSKVDYFIVNSTEELIQLRKFSKQPVFLMGYVAKKDLSLVIKLKCILSIFSIEQLKNLEKIAKKLKLQPEINLPFDALLGREGFLKEELPFVLAEIKKCSAVKLTGIYAHFANIEDTNNFTHAQKQINLYQEALAIALEAGFKNLKSHISATSGLLVYEKNKGIHPILRLGIGIYGLWPSKHIQFFYKNKIKLEPILTWKTKIAQIKSLPAGYTIGYGLTYMTYEKTTIAIIPQGYADGLSRAMSNNGVVLIKGIRCPILGRVAMNMMAVDISHLSNVKIEEEVVLLGKQGKEIITTEELAERENTINYEITTRLSPLIRRILK